MSDFPGKVSGTHDIVPWLNKLREAAISSRVTSITNGTMARGPGGTMINCGGGGGAAPSAAGHDVKWCKIETSGIQLDYLTVKEWTGVTVSGAAFNVAKSTKLRYNGGASETIDGLTVSFPSYATTTAITRVASVSGSTEKQVIVPRLQEGDLIYAISVDATGVTSATTWVDLNIDGRAWCRKYDQT